jgi:hypothetical protein
MFNVKYLDSTKKIQMPNNLKDFILKVKHLFSINSDFDIFLKNEYDFEIQITNENEYNINIHDMMGANVYILIKDKNNFQDYFNQLENNSKELDEIEKDFKKLLNDFNQFSIDKKNDKKKIKIYTNDTDFSNDFKIIPKKGSDKYNQINLSNLVDKDIKSDYSAVFLNNNDEISVLIEKVIKSPEPIEFPFYIKNNGNLEWPNDTILKCKNDNTNIFFYHITWDKNETYFNGERCYLFKIVLNFKTKNIKNIYLGIYSCRCFLISDSKGRVGNTYGQLFLNVFKDLENMNENDKDFMKKYSVESGKVEQGVI